MNLAELLTTTPAVASLLAALEREAAEERGDVRSALYIVPQHLDPSAVERALEELRDRSPDWILSRAVKAGIDIGGPWWGDGPEQMAFALRSAPDLASLADAIVDHLGAVLTEPINIEMQECWQTKRSWAVEEGGGPLGSVRAPCTPWVTATFDGMWTVTAPGPELCGPLLSAWEYDFKPITRWHLTVDSSARVLEINEPADWEALVERHPFARSSRPNSSWELPGFNQQDSTSLATIQGQRAQRTSMRRFVEPEWNAVADDFDAVHLTWAGFLTCEGTAMDLADGDVAMLRNWNSERTLWLNPVLSNPEPLPALPLPADDTDYDDWIVDARDDRERLTADLEWFRHKLG